MHLGVHARAVLQDALATAVPKRQAAGARLGLWTNPPASIRPQGQAPTELAPTELAPTELAPTQSSGRPYGGPVRSPSAWPEGGDEPHIPRPCRPPRPSRPSRGAWEAGLSLIARERGRLGGAWLPRVTRHRMLGTRTAAQASSQAKGTAAQRRPGAVASGLPRPPWGDQPPAGWSPSPRGHGHHCSHTECPSLGPCLRQDLLAGQPARPGPRPAGGLPPRVLPTPS